MGLCSSVERLILNYFNKDAHVQTFIRNEIGQIFPNVVHLELWYSNMPETALKSFASIKNLKLVCPPPHFLQAKSIHLTKMKELIVTFDEIPQVKRSTFSTYKYDLRFPINTENVIDIKITDTKKSPFKAIFLVRLSESWRNVEHIQLNIKGSFSNENVRKLLENTPSAKIIDGIGLQNDVTPEFMKELLCVKFTHVQLLKWGRRMEPQSRKLDTFIPALKTLMDMDRECGMIYTPTGKKPYFARKGYHHVYEKQ